jgi:hypothetical protein
MSWTSLFVPMAITLLVASCETPFPESRNDVVANQHDAQDYRKQGHELSMAALKGFEGDVHYVGSDDQFDYFRIERKKGFYRMAGNGRPLKGLRRFEVGAESPVRVGWGTIPHPLP